MDEVIAIIALSAAVCYASIMCFDTSIEKANIAQELCVKANSKAVSFDRIEVTCENKAIIPLKGE